MILSILFRQDDSSELDSLSWQLLQLVFSKVIDPDLCQMPSDLDPKRQLSGSRPQSLKHQDIRKLCVWIICWETFF